MEYNGTEGLLGVSACSASDCVNVWNEPVWVQKDVTHRTLTPVTRPTSWHVSTNWLGLVWMSVCTDCARITIYDPQTNSNPCWFLGNKISHCPRSSSKSSIPDSANAQMIMVFFQSSSRSIVHTIPRRQPLWMSTVIWQRQSTNVAVLVYKWLHLAAPIYLSELCIPVATFAGRNHLRSAVKECLVTSYCSCRTKNYGQQSFSYCGPSWTPTIWNLLPLTVRDSSTSLAQFCAQLKTEMFCKVYDRS